MKKDITFLKDLKIAHRGLFNNSNIPENSRIAFKEALRKNLPIEFDIQMLKDKTIVVFHDDDLKRMTGYPKAISSCTFKEIKDLHLLFTEEKIPKFEDILNLVQGKVLLDIEIKSNLQYKEMLDQVFQLLDQYQGKFIVKSFDPRCLLYIKQKRPQYIRGLLVSRQLGNYSLKSRISLCGIIFLVKPDFLAFNKKMIDNSKIQKQRRKRPILVWTLKEREILKYKDKADGFIFERDNNLR